MKRFLAPQKSNGGFTLVELLVAIALFVSVIGVVVGGFLSGIQTQRKIASLVAMNNNINLVLEQIVREVRVGRNFCKEVDETADPSDPKCRNGKEFIRFDANGIAHNPENEETAIEFQRLRGSNLVKVRYEYDSTDKLIKRTEGNASSTITAPNVIVDDFGFLVTNKRTFLLPWRITIWMKVRPSDDTAGNFEENIQTTVSPRFLPGESSGI